MVESRKVDSVPTFWPFLSLAVNAARTSETDQVSQGLTLRGHCRDGWHRRRRAMQAIQIWPGEGYYAFRIQIRPKSTISFKRPWCQVSMRPEPWSYTSALFPITVSPYSPVSI
jgi:hypothetical protein